MNHHKLTALDNTIFDLLDYSMTTSMVFAQVRFTARNTCVQSLRRMELFGLVTQTKGERLGVGKGQAESQWRRAVDDFPGVKPRAEPGEEIGPGEIPLQLRRAGRLPEWVAGRLGLAGLVAQVTQ